MSHTNLPRLLILAGAMFCGAFFSSQSSAVGCLDETGCVDCCPACGYKCHLDAQCKDTDIDGFDVESKVICIPRVVFPWQRRDACGCKQATCSKCLHNGARTRRVCVLKRDSRTCPKCEYSWEAKKRSCNCVAISTAAVEAEQAEGEYTIVDPTQSEYSDGVLYDAPYQDFSSPAAPQLNDLRQPESSEQFDAIEIFSAPQGPPGMDEALQYPTPIRPSNN